MKAIMVMFDSLNRRFLEPYGSTETMTPNFKRLAERTVQFQNCYAGSLPCIPARRELHTGRYNFLHRSWGPLEPFDDSMPQILREHKVRSHLISDHDHYWECGGATYHTQYSTWKAIRGQEADAWQPVLDEQESTEPSFFRFTGSREAAYRQNLANRAMIKEKKDFPLVQTFDEGMEFLEKNAETDTWFLQLESFAPHEPFLASEEFRQMYPITESRRGFEWPDYVPVSQTPNEIAQVRYAYFASLSMCDEQLGRVLDYMDKHQMWKDTMLIVNTDHGYLLGEHGYWAKNYMPCYDEVVHIPLFVWDPRFADHHGTVRNSLVQTLDIPVTVLDFFGIPKTSDMQGCSLAPVMLQDQKIHDSVLFGMFGGHICCTDGRYVYMRTPRNYEIPEYEYTLLPTHMTEFFSAEGLKTMRCHAGFRFTKGMPVMEIDSGTAFRCIDGREYLFDLWEDPEENQPVKSSSIQKEMEQRMHQLLTKTEAPAAVMERYGFF